MTREGTALLVGALVLASLNASATSCASMEERYVFTCVHGTCSPELRSLPVPMSSSMCARRDVVADVPPKLAAYLGRLIAASESSAANGLYSVRFQFRWWQYEPSDSFDRFEKNLLEQYIRDKDGRTLDLISIDEVADRLNRYTDRGWIKLEPPSTSAGRIRQEILDHSDRQSEAVRRELAGCWGALGIALGLLAYSIFLFRKRLGHEPSKAGGLVVPVVIQAGLLTLPILASGLLTIFSCAVTLLVWQAVVSAWLVEAFWHFRHRTLQESPTAR